MADYIGWLRRQVGHAPVQLVFAGCAVTDDRGRLLLQLRGDGDPAQWGLPGGAVELGESVEEAARREVREETGLDVSIRSLLGVYSKYRHEYPNGDIAQPITVVFHAVAVDDAALRSDGVESLAVEYFDLQHLPPLFSDQHADLVRDLEAGRRGVWR